jgi:hypothetical protein
MSGATSTLDEMADRAQRQLDGMTVNRDAMARDVLQLVRAVRSIQARRLTDQQHGGGKFTEAFDEIFDEIFGRARGGA